MTNTSEAINVKKLPCLRVPVVFLSNMRSSKEIFAWSPKTLMYYKLNKSRQWERIGMKETREIVATLFESGTFKALPARSYPKLDVPS